MTSEVSAPKEGSPGGLRHPCSAQGVCGPWRPAGWAGSSLNPRSPPAAPAQRSAPPQQASGSRALLEEPSPLPGK